MVEAIRQGDVPGVQLRRRQELKVATPDLAWQWLTEPALLERWLCAEAEVDLRPGGRVSFRSADPEILHETAEFVELDRPNLLVLAFRREAAGWNVPTPLEVTLTPNSAGVEVSVFQQGFEHLPLSDCLTIWEFYRKRWALALGRLAAVSQAS